MKPTVARFAAALVCGCAALALAGCGKRGNPMPPLQRIPAAPADLAATRLDQQVFVRFAAPATNVDGARPADVARVDVYAVTLDREPRALGELTPEQWRELSTLVSSTPVRRPVPPPPPVKEGAPPVPAPPPEPGVDQGAVVVITETLTPETATPIAAPVTGKPLPADDRPEVPRPLVAPASVTGPRRYYYAVAISARGRHGPHTGLQPVPLGATSSAPSAPEITVAETSMTIRWQPAADARGQTPPPEPDVLPSRSLAPTAPATTYDVYEQPGNQSPEAPLAVPTPLTQAPVSALEVTQDNAVLGTRRCFYVRPVDAVDGVQIHGPASAAGCASFADTFAPPPPTDLLAASVPGAISLIWEESAAKDLAGYLVLRGEAGNGTLAPLFTSPITGLVYRDEAVTSGVRYIYAVVAVDKAGNRSGESNRAEETAR